MRRFFYCICVTVFALWFIAWIGTVSRKAEFDNELIVLVRKPTIWNIIPMWGKDSIQAGFGRMWLPQDFYDDIEKDQNILTSSSVFVHERVHLQQQQKAGVVWYVKYVLSPQFRFEQELEATVAQLEVEYFRNGPIPSGRLESKATSLSSGLYLWMVPYDEALDRLKKSQIGQEDLDVSD